MMSIEYHSLVLILDCIRAVEKDRGTQLTNQRTGRPSTDQSEGRVHFMWGINSTEITAVCRGSSLYYLDSFKVSEKIRKM